MTSTSRIRTRVLILSDTHAALPDPLNTPRLPYSQPFPPADIAIHCGDLTSTGKLHEHQRALELLKSLPAPIKVVIPGNHDLTLDKGYCAQHPRLYAWSRPHKDADLEAAEAVYTSTDAQDVGIVYLVEGTHCVNLPNGASLRIYANAYTPEFCDWAFAYERTEDRFKPASDVIGLTSNQSDQREPTSPIPSFSPSATSNIDIVVTHGPPLGVLDQTTRNEAVGCAHLARAVERCKPLLHCFGHIHEGWGSKHHSWNTGEKGKTHAKINQVQDLKTEIVEKVGECAYIDATKVEHGNETVFINASIMSVQYEPRQRPWLVDLMLAATQE